MCALFEFRTRHHSHFAIFFFCFCFSICAVNWFWYPFAKLCKFVCLCVGACRSQEQWLAVLFICYRSLDLKQNASFMCLAVCMLSTSITKRKLFNENDVLKILSDLKRNRLNWTVFKSILYFFFQPHTHAERLNEW